MTKDKVDNVPSKPIKLYADNYMNQLLNRVGQPLGSQKIYTCKHCQKKIIKKKEKKKKKKVKKIISPEV